MSYSWDTACLLINTIHRVAEFAGVALTLPKPQAVTTSSLCTLLRTPRDLGQFILIADDRGLQFDVRGVVEVSLFECSLMYLKAKV